MVGEGHQLNSPNSQLSVSASRPMARQPRRFTARTISPSTTPALTDRLPSTRKMPLAHSVAAAANGGGPDSLRSSCKPNPNSHDPRRLPESGRQRHIKLRNQCHISP
ncbi:hypothetical protein FND50_12135 [Rhodococcus sp. WB9]|nr:hypothetical protein FND50_12135 [Rhodococcus sp. WB9]